MTRTRARHAAPPVTRTPGPLTAAYRISRTDIRPVSFALRAWPVIPVLFLVLPAYRLSPRLDDYASQILGYDATLCLAACVTITPVMNLFRARAAKLRWWYGIWMFALGAAGLGLTIVINAGTVGWAAGGTAQRWTGLMIVVMLLPMTITSNVAAQKALGPEWKRWQRALLWTVYGLVLLHLWALEAWWAAGGFTAATVPCIALRKASKPIKEWRQGGYSTGEWWFWNAVMGAVWLAGLTVLLTKTGLACAAAAQGA